MTPEERADAFLTGYGHYGPLGLMRLKLTATIRAAENEALERAAQKAACYSSLNIATCIAIAAEIQALKTEAPK